MPSRRQSAPNQLSPAESLNYALARSPLKLEAAAPAFSESYLNVPVQLIP